MADERLGMVMVVEVDHEPVPERPRSRTVSVCGICERVLVWIIDEESWAHVGTRSGGSGSDGRLGGGTPTLDRALLSERGDDMAEIVPLRRPRRPLTPIDDLAEAIEEAERAGHDVRRVVPRLSELLASQPPVSIDDRLAVDALVDLLAWLTHGDGMTDDDIPSEP